MIIDFRTIIGRQDPTDPDLPYPAPRTAPRTTAPRTVDPYPEPRRPAGPDRTPPSRAA